MFPSIPFANYSPNPPHGRGRGQYQNPGFAVQRPAIQQPVMQPSHIQPRSNHYHRKNRKNNQTHFAPYNPSFQHQQQVQHDFTQIQYRTPEVYQLPIQKSPLRLIHQHYGGNDSYKGTPHFFVPQTHYHQVKQDLPQFPYNHHQEIYRPKTNSQFVNPYNNSITYTTGDLPNLLYTGPFGFRAHILPAEQMRFCSTPEPISRQRGGDLDRTQMMVAGELKLLGQSGILIESLPDALREFVYERSAGINQNVRKIGAIDRGPQMIVEGGRGVGGQG